MPRVPQFPNMKHLLRGAVLTAVSVDYSTGLQCRQCWVLIYGSGLSDVACVDGSRFRMSMKATCLAHFELKPVQNDGFSKASWINLWTLEF